MVEAVKACCHCVSVSNNLAEGMERGGSHRHSTALPTHTTLPKHGGHGWEGCRCRRGLSVACVHGAVCAHSPSARPARPQCGTLQSVPQLAWLASSFYWFMCTSTFTSGSILMDVCNSKSKSQSGCVSEWVKGGTHTRGWEAIGGWDKGLTIWRTISDGVWRSMRRLWMRISKRSQVLVPSPHGLLRVVMRRVLVGRRTGPETLRFLSKAAFFKSRHTAR